MTMMTKQQIEQLLADPEVAKILQTKESRPTKDPVNTEGFENRQSVGPLFTRIEKVPAR